MKTEAGPQINLESLTPEQRKRLEQMEEARKKAIASREKCMPFVKFIKKHKLKIKTATCNKMKVEYFRVDELDRLVEDNRAKLAADPQLLEVAETWRSEVVFFNRPENMPSLRYPKELTFSHSAAKFASFKFDITESKKWLAPVILIAIIAAVLFPLWPYMLKYTVFLICLYLLIAIIATIIVRLVVYLFFAIFGLSLWILPNFFADCGILESFFPVLSVERWQTDFYSVIGRLIALSIFGYYSYHFYLDPSWVFENVEITKTSINDLHDWGVGKIKGQKNFSQSALTDINDIINQTEDVQEVELNPSEEIIDLDSETVDAEAAPQNTNKQADEQATDAQSL